MSKPTTPESKRWGSTATKVAAAKRAEWDFTTLGTTDVGWVPLDRSRPNTTAGKPVASSPYIKDSSQEEENAAKEGAAKEALPAKAKPTKASADLSPYMSASPYISRAGAASHSRPVSRGMPSSSSTFAASNVYSHRRSLPHAPGVAGSGSRPITPVIPAARPKSQGSSDQLGGGDRGYSVGYGSSLKPKDQGPQRPVSQGTIGFGLGSSTGPSIRAVSHRPITPGDVSPARPAVSRDAKANVRSPRGTTGRSLGQAVGYVGDCGDLSLGPSAAPKSPIPSPSPSPIPSPACQTVEASRALKHKHKAKRDVPGPAAESPASPASPARPISQPIQSPARSEDNSRAEPGPSPSPSPTKTSYAQRPPPSPSSFSRPSVSRASTCARRSLSPEPPSPPKGLVARANSENGHRAAALAISGLGDCSEASRPTTQERHAAQRERLGFGRRPTTQERQSLTTRAGPRSAPKRSSGAERPGSRGGRSEELTSQLRSSFSERSSRLKHSEGSGDHSDGLRRSMSSSSRTSSRYGSSGRAKPEEWAPDIVPVIAENTDGEAYGMTLSDYMSQMGSASSQRPLSGASATMAAEDCIPPDDASLLSDISECSDYSYVDKFGTESSQEDYDDLSYTQYSGQLMDRSGIPWEPVATGSSFSTAAGNGLDLRPATAALDGSTQKPLLGHDAIASDGARTREVDLASLPAALFHPREESELRRPSGSGRSDSVWHRQSSSGRASGGSTRHSGGRSSAKHRTPRGTRKTQSARPMMLEQDPANPSEDTEDGDEADLDDDDNYGSDEEWGEMHYSHIRPPSRQRPPPEALHLFNALGHSNKGALTPTMSIKPAGDGRSSVHRPKTTAAPTRPLSGPQLRLKSDGSGFQNATEKEKEKLSKMSRPPSRMRNPVQSATIRHNAAEDFPELPPKGQGEYDLDIMGISSDSEYDC